MYCYDYLTASQITHTPGEDQRALDLYYGQPIYSYNNSHYPLKSKRWQFSPLPETKTELSSFQGSCGFPWTTPIGNRTIPLQSDNFDNRALTESRLLGLVPEYKSELPLQRDSPNYASANTLNYRLNVCDLVPMSTRNLKWKSPC